MLQVLKRPIHGALEPTEFSTLHNVRHLQFHEGEVHLLFYIESYTIESSQASTSPEIRRIDAVSVDTLLISFHFGIAFAEDGFGTVL